jgi:hypothetical protein
MFELFPCPPGRPEANGGVPPALVDSTISLPAPLGLRSRFWLAALCTDRHLSARKISRCCRGEPFRGPERGRFLPRHTGDDPKNGHLTFGL